MARDRTIEVHGRQYRIPTKPVAVVCVDGFDPEYLDAGIAAGVLPNIKAWTTHGFHTTATGAMPSLTNPNNLCIITGQPTKVHGVSGNYYLDKKTGEERMITDSSTMRGTTILEHLANAGVRMAAITAKDKLRKIINHGLSPANNAICFSSQRADTCTHDEHGISDVAAWLGQPVPEQYSGDLSIFVLDAGVKLLQEGRAQLLYLTLSDFIQHMHAPTSPETLHFMQLLDERLGELHNLGATVAVTGDHGMSAKTLHNGEPDILFLEDFLHAQFPEAKARVICPIADPFVKHHGSLGGFVRVYLGAPEAVDIENVLQACRRLPQVREALTGEEAASRYEMPLECEGEMVVISTKGAVIGSRADEHDLSQLSSMRLRSHGGSTELAVPLIRSTPIGGPGSEDDRAWRNYDIFDLALNY